MFPEASPLIQALSEGNTTAPLPHDGTPVIAALIGGAVAIAVAIITGYFGTKGERPGRAARRTSPDLAAQMRELEHEAAIAENERRDAESETQRLSARVDALERALVLRGYAPWRFISGEETDAETCIHPRG